MAALKAQSKSSQVSNVIKEASMTDSVIKVDIYQNITLTNNSVFSAGYRDKHARGSVITSTRSAGAIKRNKDGSCYADFRPIPSTMIDKYGRANHAAIVLHYSNGESEILTTDQIDGFWTKVLNLDVEASSLNLQVKYDIPVIETNLAEIEEAIYENVVRAVKITLNNPSAAFNFSYHDWEYQGEEVSDLVLSPINCDIELVANILETPVQAIGFSMTRSDVSKRAIKTIDVSRISKSAKRKAKRQAKHKSKYQTHYEEEIKITVPQDEEAVNIKEPSIVESISEEPVITPPKAQTQSVKDAAPIAEDEVQEVNISHEELIKLLEVKKKKGSVAINNSKVKADPSFNFNDDE